jgi:hypothetical protein
MFVVAVVAWKAHEQTTSHSLVSNCYLSQSLYKFHHSTAIHILTLRCCGPLSARAHACGTAETVSTCSYCMVLQLIQAIYVKNGKAILQTIGLAT